MRFSPAVLVLALATSTLSVAVSGQCPDDQIAAQSVSLQRQGEAALAAGQLAAAQRELRHTGMQVPQRRVLGVQLLAAHSESQGPQRTPWQS